MSKKTKKLKNTSAAEPASGKQVTTVPPAPSPHRYGWWLANGVLVLGCIGIAIVIGRLRQEWHSLQAMAADGRPAAPVVEVKPEPPTVRAWLDQAAKAPQNLEVRQQLAAYFEQHGQAERAINYYRQALALAADNAELHFSLGRLLLNIPGQQPQALEQLQQVLTLTPTHPQREAIALWIKSLTAQTQRK